MHIFSHRYFPIISIVVLTLLVYASALPHAMFWDDNDWILNNMFVTEFDLSRIWSESVTSGAGILSNYFRPVLSTVFAIEWALWGGTPFLFRLVNVSIHAADAVLVYLLLVRLFKNKAAAYATALIFALHPLQTESVTYVNSLGDSLSFLFTLIALNSIFIKKKILSSWFRYGISPFILLPLALLSKELSIILIMLYGLVYYYHLPHRSFVKTCVAMAPFLFIGALYIYLRATVWNFQNTFNLYGETNAFTDDILLRITVFFKAYLTYLGLLIAPIDQHMERTIAYYPAINTQSILGGILFAVTFVAALYGCVKRHIYGFAAVWFLIGLSPVSNIMVPINGLIYEHWLYVPMVGFFFCIFYYLHQRIGKGMYYVLGVLMMLCIVKTILRNNEWRDPITFYTQTLAHARSYRVANNLGMEYANIQDEGQAIEHYDLAIDIDPEIPVAYYNKANTLVSQGKSEEAIKHYQTSLEKDPDFIYAFTNLMSLYQAEHRQAEGVAFAKIFIPKTKFKESAQLYVMRLFK